MLDQESRRRIKLLTIENERLHSLIQQLTFQNEELRKANMQAMAVREAKNEQGELETIKNEMVSLHEQVLSSREVTMKATSDLQYEKHRNSELSEELHFMKLHNASLNTICSEVDSLKSTLEQYKQENTNLLQLLQHYRVFFTKLKQLDAKTQFIPKFLDIQRRMIEFEKKFDKPIQKAQSQQDVLAWNSNFAQSVNREETTTPYPQLLPFVNKSTMVGKSSPPSPNMYSSPNATTPIDTNAQPTILQQPIPLSHSQDVLLPIQRRVTAIAKKKRFSTNEERERMDRNISVLARKSHGSLYHQHLQMEDYPLGCIWLSAVGIISTFVVSQTLVLRSLIYNIRDEVNTRVSAEIKNLLTDAETLTLSAQKLFHVGVLSNSSTTEELSRNFFSYSPIFQEVAQVFLINEPRNYFFGINRDAPGEYSYQVSNSSGFPIAYSYKVANVTTGVSSTTPYKAYDFNPVTRPYFQRGKAAGVPTWSTSYLGEPGNTLYNTLTAPLVDQQTNAFYGLVAVDLSTASLSDAFSQIKIGTSGLTFVLEPSTGFLIAASKYNNLSVDIYKTINGVVTRVKAIESAVPIIQGAAAYIESVKSTLVPQKNRNFELQIQNSYVIATATLYDTKGLSWIQCIVVNYSDFTDTFNVGLSVAIFIAIFFIFISSMFAIFISMVVVMQAYYVAKRYKTTFRRKLERQLELQEEIHMRDGKLRLLD